MPTGIAAVFEEFRGMPGTLSVEEDIAASSKAAQGNMANKKRIC
jgi:hypothetical protein